MHSALGTPRLRTRNVAEVGWFLLCVAIAAAIAIAFGQDANWDLRNYHFYNPWALLNGRIGWDIAPAQLQTYINPEGDIPFYAMVRAGWPPQAISAVLALPAGVGFALLGKLALTMFRELPRAERWTCVALAFLIGVTASHAVGMIGLTMNDWLGAPLAIGALLMVANAIGEGQLPPGRLVTAGALMGIAAGLKLTNAPYVVGLAVALLACPPTIGRALSDVLWFGCGAVAGFAAGGGYWALLMWKLFESPVFPFFNDYIHSRWWRDYPVVGFYGPHTVMDWIVFPLRFFKTDSGIAGESAFRDWRLPMLYLAALGLGVRGVWRRLPQQRSIARSVGWPGRSAPIWRLLVVYWVASFVLWRAQHSIYRYIVPLELLTGTLLVGALRYVLTQRFFVVAAVAATIVAIVPTRYIDYQHIPFGHRWFEVRIPPVQPHALVILHSGAPMAYLLPFFPPDARFVAVNNSFTHPDWNLRVQDDAHDIIDKHVGPIYSLTSPPGSGAEFLAAFDLVRVGSTCVGVMTNMPGRPVELCLLQRMRFDSTADPNLPQGVGRAITGFEHGK